MLKEDPASIPSESFLRRGSSLVRFFQTLDAHILVHPYAYLGFDPFHYGTFGHHLTSRSTISQGRSEPRTRWSPAKKTQSGLYQPPENRVWGVSLSQYHASNAILTRQTPLTYSPFAHTVSPVTTPNPALYGATPAPQPGSLFKICKSPTKKPIDPSRACSKQLSISSPIISYGTAMAERLADRDLTGLRFSTTETPRAGL